LCKAFSLGGLFRGEKYKVFTQKGENVVVVVVVVVVKTGGFVKSLFFTRFAHFKRSKGRRASCWRGAAWDAREKKRKKQTRRTTFARW
jgi:hypothetical protein